MENIEYMTESQVILEDYENSNKNYRNAIKYLIEAIQEKDEDKLLWAIDFSNHVLSWDN